MQFKPTPLAVALAALFSHNAIAQTQPPQQPATNPSTQTLSPVFVTGSPLGSNLFELADPVNVLQGRGLMLKQQPTLGATLEQEVGVNSTNFGPNASRPVIRGLGGFDIRLLNNGIGLLDASSASPDHAVAVSPFAVERIEVVRGPATVMYGGSAIGGVVNTIDSRIAQRPLDTPFGGAASYLFDSKNDLSAGGARIDGGSDRFALHADAYATRNSDLKIPGSAWTPEVQTIRGEPGPNGTLPNSQGDSQSYGFGATTFFDKRSYAGISYSKFDTNYGTVAEPNVTIDLKQQAWNFAGELRDTVPGFDALRVKYGYNDYEHTEFEGSEAGTMFESKGWNLRLEGLHGKLGPFEGAIGLEMAKVDFSALGAEAFVPSTTTKNIAAFVYEEMRHDAWKFSLGARVENSKIDAEEFIGAGLPADSVSFTPWSGAFGSVYSFDKQWSFGANVQYTQRAPSSQELFADGPHIATNQFEVGDRALNKVTSTSIDLTLKRQGEFFTGTAGAFYSNFSNFVGLFPTDIFRNPEDRSVAPGPEPYIDPGTGEEVEPIQQFNYAQVRARFYGFEAQLGFPVWKEGLNLLSMKLQADYVNATDRSNGQPLPFIPPLRVGASLTYEREALTATLGALFASSQNRVPQFQTTTPGYTNLFLNASYRFMFGAGTELEVFLQGTNLLDETIRYSTSSLKDIAPAGGRAVMAGVRGAF
ncbi:MAG: TonB-dependent receptor [Burkholderiaceae bacterium]|nr:TonB-dependent receptor [Burkholderiaceae bacterium]